MEKNMEEEFFNLQMVIFMTESGNLTEKMVKDNLYIKQKTGNMMGNSERILNTDMGF